MFIPFGDILRRTKKFRTSEADPEKAKTEKILAEWCQGLPLAIQKTVGRPTVLSFREHSVVIGVARSASLPDLAFYRVTLEEALSKKVSRGRPVRVSFRYS